MRAATVHLVRLGAEVFVLINEPAPLPSPRRSLSEAEHAVVRLACAGMSNDAIAARRGTSRRTVINQLSSAYRKLAIASRGELLARFSGLSPDEVAAALRPHKAADAPRAPRQAGARPGSGARRAQQGVDGLVHGPHEPDAAAHA